jgi:hypothetical protein
VLLIVIAFTGVCEFTPSVFDQMKIYIKVSLLFLGIAKLSRF